VPKPRHDHRVAAQHRERDQLPDGPLAVGVDAQQLRDVANRGGVTCSCMVAMAVLVRLRRVASSIAVSISPRRRSTSATLETTSKPLPAFDNLV
jgi:hypothetical protein